MLTAKKSEKPAKGSPLGGRVLPSPGTPPVRPLRSFIVMERSLHVLSAVLGEAPMIHFGRGRGERRQRGRRRYSAMGTESCIAKVT